MKKDHLNKILWGIIVIFVNIILTIIFYIPLLSKDNNGLTAINIFFYSFTLFSIYSLYLTLFKLSRLKLIIYLCFIAGLIGASILNESINQSYNVDSCLDSGYGWNRDTKKCIME